MTSKKKCPNNNIDNHGNTVANKHDGYNDTTHVLGGYLSSLPTSHPLYSANYPSPPNPTTQHLSAPSTFPDLRPNKPGENLRNPSPGSKSSQTSPLQVMSSSNPSNLSSSSDPEKPDSGSEGAKDGRPSSTGE